jgi:DHA1 family bicyclomycin/chloramphenicol resistance-like MFS transporter
VIGIRPNSLLFTAILGVFAALPPLSIDLSAPTLPLLPAELGTTETVAGLTLSLFMVGFALGQLGAGTFSDERGRRPVLLYGLSCFVLSGIACALAPSGLVLASSRFIQGFGAGACAVIAFAIVQDLFEGDEARTKRSYVATVFTATPILAPAAGSVLVSLFGWRSVHAVLAGLGLLLLMTAWLGVVESRGARSAAHPTTNDIADRLHRDIPFLRIAAANALSYAVIFVYIAASPLVIIGKLGYSSTVFAGVFACTALALTLGAWTNGRLSRRGVGPRALINPAFVGNIAATAALALGGVTHITPGYIILPLLMAVLFARGILAPNLQHLAIERGQQRAGAASALVGVSQLLAGAGASAVVAALLPAFGLNAVVVAMAALAAASCVAWRWVGY